MDGYRFVLFLYICLLVRGTAATVFILSLFNQDLCGQRNNIGGWITMLNRKGNTFQAFEVRCARL